MRLGVSPTIEFRNSTMVQMARILRARGNKGEVAAKLLTDFPERLTKLKEVFVGQAGGKTEPRLVALKSCWLSQNHRGQSFFISRE